jgi:hypothetical protein
MSKNLWISSDESIEWENRSWITNAHVFNNIFDRVKSAFLPTELACQESCFFDWGMEGIDLSDVEKDCFNIFYLRCKSALSQYPDEKEMKFQEMSEDRIGTHKQVAWAWEEILKRLELDKRYDASWIESYKSMGT